MLRSQNSAVVMAVAGVHWLFAPRKDLRKIVKPLLFLLRSSYDSQYVVSRHFEDVLLELVALFIVLAVPSITFEFYKFVR